VDHLEFREWQKPCEEALLESDAKKIFQRIVVAEAAIFHRLRGATGRVDSSELEAIEAMLNKLRSLIANSFAFPDRHERNRSTCPPRDPT
jgi:hypothetical protein